MLRIGYSFWGYLGDKKLGEFGNHVSTPDGNATYSWALVKRAMEAGHEVIPMMPDRDRPGWSIYGTELFKSFSQWKRSCAYMHLRYNGAAYGSYDGFPELDVLLLEWRFPIPGRNTPADKQTLSFQPDLQRQTELLEYYRDKKTKIILWDLDHKLTKEDEERWLPNAVFETAVKPRKLSEQRTRVEPPIVTDDLMQFGTVECSTLNRGLVYIGSRYERDDVIDRWIASIGLRVPVEFYGKWDGDCHERWPYVRYGERCTVEDFLKIYQDAPLVPLLAKQSYFDTGFITPRPWEALMFGSYPIGLNGHLGVDQYTNLIAVNVDDLVHLTKRTSWLSLKERHVMREELAHKLSFMDAKNMVKEIERVVG